MTLHILCIFIEIIELVFKISLSPVLPDGLHAGLLADGVDVGAGDLVRPGHVVLEVDLVGEVHLGGDGGEDEALLAAVR